MTEDCNREMESFSRPAISARWRAAPPAAAARRASASLCQRRLLDSMATAGGQRDVAGVPAIGAIEKTIGAQAYALVARADGAGSFTSSAIFVPVSLHADGRT